MVSKFGDRLMVIIEQGGTAKRAFNAIDGTINNMTITIVFSYYKRNPCRTICYIFFLCFLFNVQALSSFELSLTKTFGFALLPGFRATSCSIIGRRIPSFFVQSLSVFSTPFYIVCSLLCKP
jgi:hypothetical protein